MSYRNRPKLYCKDCQWYTQEGKLHIKRCTVESNKRYNWRGLIYIKHPTHKNYNRKCDDYTEIVEGGGNQDE
jgi:hypothetical protein